MQSERESLFIVNNFARDYFQNILKNHVDGRSIGMAYFRNRGFRDDIIEKFQLGYCFRSWPMPWFRKTVQEGIQKRIPCQDRALLRETDDHRLRDRFLGTCFLYGHTFPLRWSLQRGAGA